MPPDTLRDLIGYAQPPDDVAQKAHRAFALPADLDCKNLRRDKNKVNHYRFTWEDVGGLLYQKGRLYVPPASDARKEIFR